MKTGKVKIIFGALKVITGCVAVHVIFCLGEIGFLHSFVLMYSAVLTLMQGIEDLTEAS